jgi:transposase InsO family protein
MGRCGCAGIDAVRPDLALRGRPGCGTPAQLGRAGTGRAFIEPGAPWQNGYVESFNGKIRDELLSGELFDTLTEAKVLIEDWRIDYNWNRPHSALGNMTPAAFAATLKITKDHT